ncbi:unnamed protein product [Nesidiocoris tenuis]|uniref:Uncharacterized protein n=1 Tax=Nesidiocoris tenuis TaxID=355587 RepID=A0A6H5HRM9_9HEMI|nr:unnamed protein product [Nesidiocoris tenuis]
MEVLESSYNRESERSFRKKNFLIHIYSESLPEQVSRTLPNKGPIPLSGSKTSGSGTCSVPEQFETEQSVAPLVEPEATPRPSGSGRIILSFDWLSDPTVTDVKKFRNLNFSPPCRTIVAVIETFNRLIISLVYILLISCAIAETLLIFHSEHLLRLKNDGK